MKFNLFLTEALKQKEIKNILNDPDFNIGVEFEFFLANYVTKTDLRNELNKLGIPKDWEITDDSSLHTTKESDIGVELVTPILNLQQFLYLTPRIFNLIDHIGYTNDTCGLHINVSHNKYKNQINPEILASLAEDPRIYKTFPSREKSSYADSSERKFQLGQGYIQGKHQTINVKNDYVEFRGIGGKDYQKHWDEIRKITLNYLGKYLSAINIPDDINKKFLKKRFSVYQKTDQDVLELIQQKKWNILIADYMYKFHIWIEEFIKNADQGKIHDIMDKMFEINSVEIKMNFYGYLLDNLEFLQRIYDNRVSLMIVDPLFKYIKEYNVRINNFKLINMLSKFIKRAYEIREYSLEQAWKRILDNATR